MMYIVIDLIIRPTPRDKLAIVRQTHDEEHAGVAWESYSSLIVSLEGRRTDQVVGSDLVSQRWEEPVNISRAR